MDVIDLSRLKYLRDSELAATDVLLVVDDSATTEPDDDGKVKGILVSEARQAIAGVQGITNMTADGAVTIQPGIVTLSKAGVLAATLAAPTAAQEGTRITFTSKSANAHTVTATGLFEDGVTGGAKNTATFAAFVGATFTVIAINLKWHTESLKAVTVA